MNFSLPFVMRPVATMLLALALLLTGAVAYRFLPVAALPAVDIPTIVVFAGRPGADPETMANSIAAPLERRLSEIGGVAQITSTNSTGSTSIVVQFELDRDVEGAAHDVQAALNAATADLPSDLPTRPYYRRFNPAEFPILTLSATSDVLSPGAVYDAVDVILAQRLSQVDGVGQVQVGGAERPAVRVRLNPAALKAAGLSSQDVYTAIRAANVNGPLGGFQGPERSETIQLNGQITQASEYARLVLKSSGAATVRLGDVAEVLDSVANTRLAAWQGKQRAILLTVTKTAGANVIDTVDRLKAVLPQLLAWMPPDIKVTVLADRTATIRASVDGVQRSLFESVGLVLLVVALFMRRMVPTLAAAVTVPLSLSGTLAAMYLLGYSLNNFSLMALTISVGFVVDDAIVMIENVTRHMEAGAPPLRAAIEGARQIGFTVVSISLSLVAVFIPVTFMGGIMGRFFHEFAVIMTVAILISAAVSLTLTPMMLGRFAKHGPEARRPSGTPGAGGPGRRWASMLARAWAAVNAALDRGFAATTRGYTRSLGWALRWRWLMVLVTVAAMAGTVKLYGVVPKGFLPVQDTGLMEGFTLADPGTSFASMVEKQRRVVDVLLADPAIADVGSTVGITSGWSSLNRGQLIIALKPFADRDGATSEQVLRRLARELMQLAGVQTILWSSQDVRGGNSGGTAFEFVLLGENLEELRSWTQRMEERLRTVQGIADVNSDQDRPGPEARAVIDREAAARLGVNVSAVDAALNNAYAQRQVSIIYTERNQYRVVLETLPQLQADPALLGALWVPGANGTQVPLLSVMKLERASAPLAVKHRGQFPAATISFNLLPGTSLGDATQLVADAARDLRLPEGIRTEFGGNARWLQQSLASQPFLIAAAVLAIYIVLGILYESVLHPLTIISTLPSAGLGAVLAVLVTGQELNILGIVGIILLMGIVKKNAIMLVDFALEAERERGMEPLDAIREACLERFRPIIMTTLAALLGALPLALSNGIGAEFRRPLGIAIVGGLLVSQVLTLYTTPVIYLVLERLARVRRPRIVAGPASAAPIPAE